MNINYFKKIITLFILFLGITAFTKLLDKKITVFIVGDSTVKCGQDDGTGGLWGWGNPLNYHFDTSKVNIENHALGGTSSRSFQTRGLWQQVVDKIKPGDYVLIQFGHNDGGSYNTGRARASIKGTGKDTLHVIMEATGKKEIIHTYGWYLRKYISDTRKKGGVPVIVTPIPRNDWKDKKVQKEGVPYSVWAKEVAKAEDVFVVDLHEKMKVELNKLGENAVTGKYFFARDHTHTTADGAMLNARLVAKGLLELENCKLSKHVIEKPEYEFPYKHQPILRYDFGGTLTSLGFINVGESSIYSDLTGFGFDYESKVTIVERKTGNYLESDFCTSHEPFYFSAKVPEGNYRVTLWLGDKEGRSVTTVKAESRRLMLEKIETLPGKIKKCSFIVNVRTPKINDTLSIKLKGREIPYLNWDNKLTLEFNDSLPCICGIEIEPLKKVKTLFIAGNSTVTDQNYEPWAAWGQMITRFISDKTVVANLAESGESLRSSYYSKRLEKVLSLIKPGDYFFIEFGHNDQKIKGKENGAYGSYSDFLRMYIDKTKEKGGIPVLITSMHRRKFDENGKIINTLGDFPDAMRKVAKEKNVALIDLNNMSKTLYETWGVKNSVKAFCHYPANTYPNQTNELKDNTHFNNYGAYHIALCILQGINDNKIGVGKYISDDFKGFEPNSPIPYNQWKLPESRLVSNEKPHGY